MMNDPGHNASGSSTSDGSQSFQILKIEGTKRKLYDFLTILEKELNIRVVSFHTGTRIMPWRVSEVQQYRQMYLTDFIRQMFRRQSPFGRPAVVDGNSFFFTVRGYSKEIDEDEGIRVVDEEAISAHYVKYSEPGFRIFKRIYLEKGITKKRKKNKFAFYSSGLNTIEE